MKTLTDLASARRAKGWSVSELARQSNTSDLTITRLESGGACTPEVESRILSALRPTQTAPVPVEPTPAPVVKPSWTATVYKNGRPTSLSVDVTSEGGA